MTVSFQTSINYQPGAALPGDFASTVAANVNAVVLAGPGGLVAGTGGVTVGTFAWVQTDGVTVLATGTGAPSGFVDRVNNIALITTYGAGFGSLIPAGYGITLMNGGDFWAATTTVATVGQKVFASLTASTIATGTAGATVTGFAETPFYVASAGGANTLIKISSRIP